MSEQDGIVWEEPGPTNRWPGGIDWMTVLTGVKSRPGEWARVAEKPTPAAAGVSAHALRVGKITSVPPGRWEFASRGVNGKGYVYARYLGKKKR